MSEPVRTTGLGDVIPSALKASSHSRVDADLTDNPIAVWAGQPELESGFHKLDHTVFRGGVCAFEVKELARVRNARTTNCFL
jgi:hypothetical protein